MAQSNIEALQRENAELRGRLDQFRKLLDEVFEPRMIDLLGPDARSRLIQSMAPAEIGPHLRALALRCQSLARDSTDARAARELAETAGELADRASGLEAIFAIPAAIRSP
jgi:hypothetical protein